jgi:hypothetical protein
MRPVREDMFTDEGLGIILPYLRRSGTDVRQNLLGFVRAIYDHGHCVKRVIDMGKAHFGY